MKKLLITLLISILVISGCSVVRIENNSVGDILNTILYVDSNLSNTYMNGYELYLPQGLKIVDKNDFNLKIKDNNTYYYLYIDTIAYHYKVENSYQENNSHFYSQKFNHNGKSGFIDIVDNGDYYFVVLMYNYAKVETYILKDNFNSSLMNMCSLLSTIKYNDKVITGYVGDKKTIYQEERFNIFDSEAENDNFLKYEDEYGTYKESIVINKDNDVIEIDEIVE